MGSEQLKSKGVGKSVLFWLGVLFTLAAPIIVGTVLRDPSTTWVVALCGAFVTLLVKLDDLVELSLGPVKAKMRETVIEAHATVDQLRTVAAVTAKASLTDLMSSNFMSGTTLKTRLDLHDSVIAALKSIGASDSAVRDADEMWRRGIGVTYHRAILKRIQQQTTRRTDNDPVSDEKRRAPNEFQELLDFENWLAPTPNVIRAFLTSKDLMTPEISLWIDDYEHFIGTGEIRRRDQFVRE